MMRLRNGVPDRRRQDRGIPGGEPTRAQLVSMILGTYREMPGLCLHLRQAARLFGVRFATCEIVLEDLVALGKLRRTADGQIVGGDLEGTKVTPFPRDLRMPNNYRRGH